MLHNALNQTEGVGVVDGKRWAEHLLQRVAELDVPRLADDVRPFLEQPQDADGITVENLRSVLVRGTLD